MSEISPLPSIYHRTKRFIYGLDREIYPHEAEIMLDCKKEAYKLNDKETKALFDWLYYDEPVKLDLDLVVDVRHSSYLNTRLSSLKKRLNLLEDEIEEAEDELRSMNRELDSLVDEIDEIEGELKLCNWITT